MISGSPRTHSRGSKDVLPDLSGFDPPYIFEDTVSTQLLSSIHEGRRNPVTQALATARAIRKWGSSLLPKRCVQMEPNPHHTDWIRRMPTQIVTAPRRKTRHKDCESPLHPAGMSTEINTTNKKVARRKGCRFANVFDWKIRNAWSGSSAAPSGQKGPAIYNAY